MTQSARKVLADCEFILSRLENEPNDQLWRIYWVAVVTLLRAVGHVLHKIDGQEPSVKRVANQLFKSWNSNDPTHEIYREFIEKERNNTVKEYVLGVSEGPVAVTGLEQDPETGEWFSSELHSLDENIYRPMNEGFYQHEDGRTLIELAIEWWKQQLNEVDRLASAQKW